MFGAFLRENEDLLRKTEPILVYSAGAYCLYTNFEKNRRGYLEKRASKIVIFICDFRYLK